MNGTDPHPALTEQGAVDHEARGDIAELKRVVGRIPYLDDPGSGIARATHETRGDVASIKDTVSSTRRVLLWGLGIVVATMLGREALTWRLVSIPTAPAAAATAPPKGSP